MQHNSPGVAEILLYTCAHKLSNWFIVLQLIFIITAFVVVIIIHIVREKLFFCHILYKI